MEFWGVEVKPGESLKVKPEVFRLIHISQAALGEVEDGKGPNYIPIHLKVGDKKYVLGSLSAEDRPQLMFDLVFEREFELSHDWKDGSIYFAGYVADDDTGEIESSSEDDEGFSDEDNKVDAHQKGTLDSKADGLKSSMKKNLPAKPKPSEMSTLKHEELKKDESESESDDDGSNVSEDEDEVDDDEDSEGSDDGSQDLVSQKIKSGKRPSETATMMFVPAAKKTKSAAPQKPGGKSLATNGKSKEHNPKSSGQVACKSCSKTFNSEKALQSHAQAKHGGK